MGGGEAELTARGHDCHSRTTRAVVPHSPLCRRHHAEALSTDRMTVRTMPLFLITVFILQAVWSQSELVAASRAPNSLEEIDLFPEQYAGQTFTLDGLFLEGVPYRTGEHFLITVKTKRGTIITPTLLPGKLAMSVTPAIARQLVGHELFEDHDRVWIGGVRLTFTLRRIDQPPSRKEEPYWIGAITEVQVLSRTSGKPLAVFRDPLP